MGQEQSMMQYGGEIKYNELLKTIKDNPDPITARAELSKLDKTDLKNFINYIDMSLTEGAKQNYARGNILSRLIWVTGDRYRKTVSFDFEMLNIYLDNIDKQRSLLLYNPATKGYIKYLICILKSSPKEITDNATSIFGVEKYKKYLTSYVTVNTINDELRYKLFCKIIELFYPDSLDNNLITNQCKDNLQNTYAIYISDYINSFTFNHNYPSETDTNIINGELFTILSCDPILNIITDPISTDKQIIGALISSLIPVPQIVAKFGEDILDNSEVILIGYFNTLFSDSSIDITEFNNYKQDFDILSKHQHIRNQLQIWFNKNYKTVSSTFVPIMKQINPNLNTPKDKEPVESTSNDIKLPRDFNACKEIFQKVKNYAEKTNNNELKKILQYDLDLDINMTRSQTQKTGRFRRSTKKLN